MKDNNNVIFALLALAALSVRPAAAQSTPPPAPTFTAYVVVLSPASNLFSAVAVKPSFAPIMQIVVVGTNLVAGTTYSLTYTAVGAKQTYSEPPTALIATESTQTAVFPAIWMQPGDSLQAPPTVTASSPIATVTSAILPD